MVSVPGTPANRRLRVFLCHASEDKARARELYRTLESLGVDAWLDERKLIPGQHWQSELTRALHDSDLVFVCLSGRSVSKEGTVQREIRIALDLAQEKPENALYIVPVRLEGCEVPSSLRHIQYLDCTQPDWLPRLLGCLAARSVSLGISWKHILSSVGPGLVEFEDLPEGAVVRMGDLEGFLGPPEMTLLSIAQSLESRDPYNSHHCARIAATGVGFASRLGFARSDLLVLLAAAYLHDIGKLFVPPEILFKPGQLTAGEFEVLKTHTIRGEEICRPFEKLASVLPLIRHHHERWDGSGYPEGLAGERIPVLARVLQLSDFFDVMTCYRPYRRSMSPREIVDVLKRDADQGRLDPDLASGFSDFILADAAASGAPGTHL